MKALVYWATVPPTCSSAEITGLEMMQKLVFGYVEAIPGPHDSMLWVNEEGSWTTKEGQRLRLPKNELASELFQIPLVGTVIVTGEADEEGETKDIPPALVQMLRDLGVIPDEIQF